MPSLFTRALCCCCLRPRSKSPVSDDEHSRLIPPESEVPSYTQPHPIVIDHQKLKERLGAIVRTKEGLKNAQRGSFFPAQFTQKNVAGNRAFYSSSKSVTSDDRDATDPGGSSNHHPHSIPQNSSLVSFRTEETSPTRDDHDRDQDPPTVLNIRLASGGVYGSERSRNRGRSDQRIVKTHPEIAFDSEEGNLRSLAPSHTTSVSRSSSPSLSRTRPKAIIKEPVTITRSWKDE